MRDMQLPGERKLSLRWLGPFVILNRVGPVVYLLDPMKGIWDRPLFYTLKLKEYRDPRNTQETGIQDSIEIGG